MTFWAVMARQRPFAEFSNSFMQIVYAASVIGGSKRPDLGILPLCVTSEIKQLITRCWASQSQDRPNMDEVLQALGLIVTDQVEPVVDEEDENLCVVCLEKPISHVLIPCGHMCVCEDCAGKLHECPLDRRVIDSVTKVYN